MENPQMNPAVAVAISSHHHYSIVVIFCLGYILHAWMQVDGIARSKDNPITSRLAIIMQNAARLASRFFVSLLVFLFVWNNPSTVPVVLGYLGLTLSANAIAIMTLPMSPPVSGIMGFAVDSLLAYVPMLKNALPPIEFTRRETDKVTVERSHTVTDTPIDTSLPPSTVTTKSKEVTVTTGPETGNGAKP